MKRFSMLAVAASLAGGLALPIAPIGCGPAEAPRPPAPPAPPQPAVVATLDAGPPAPADPFPDDAAIAKAGDDYIDLVVELMPETATELGIHVHDDRLDAYDVAGHDKVIEREEAMKRALEERFKDAKASPAAKADLAMVVGALTVDIATAHAQRPLQRQPDYYANPMNAIFVMTARDYAPPAERAKNVLTRLEQIPGVIASAKKNLESPPKVWTEIGIEQASQAKDFFEEQRAFLKDALPNEPRVDADLKAAEAAYDDYAKFLKKEVLPRSNGKFAAGRELFELRLKNDYFLDESPEDLLAAGNKLVADTDAELNATAKKIDPKAKGWPEVVAKIKGKHPTAPQLLDAYRTEVKRAREFLVAKDAVEFPPGDELEVMDTPPFLRNVITAAYDQPPAFDPNATKGFFFVTPVDPTLSKAKQEEMLRENDHADIVDTSVHEAYPGHHLQLSFARRNPSAVRKALGSSIFAEGWALYSEQLMGELGYYTDEEKMLVLEWALVRAARVVLDVSLHTRDMTFDDAVKMLTDRVHLEKPLATSEVKRYTLTPTQPLSYAIGREGILKLRERVKARDGAAFSLKKFHTDLLSRGTVPPSLIAREMFAAP